MNSKTNFINKCKLKYVITLIFIILVVLGIVFIRIINKQYSSGGAEVQKWNEMSISKQFCGAEYDNNEYYTQETEILSDRIEKKLTETTLIGYDNYTGTTYNKKANLFSIKNISKQCAIAVRFEGDNNYYVYTNSYYKPKTLGEFMKDLNLRDNAFFDTIYYNYLDKNTKENISVEFYNVDNDVIWQKLFNNLNLENIYSDIDNSNFKYTSETFTQKVNISTNIPLLGLKNVSITLTDKGYLITNILGTGKGFYIEETKVQEFIKYITENYKSHKTS